LLIPIPKTVSARLCVRVFSTGHRIVDDGEIGTPTDDGAANTNCEVAPVLVRVPPTGSLRVSRNRVSQRRTILLNEIPRRAAELLGKLDGVRGANDLMVWMLCQVPSGKEFGGIHTLPATRGHKDHQSVNVTSTYCLKFFDNQLMVLRRLIPAPTGPVRHVASDIPAREKLFRRLD
jgi:hypothetical protein